MLLFCDFIVNLSNITLHPLGKNLLYCKSAPNFKIGFSHLYRLCFYFKDFIGLVYAS